jgi:hypothetical protein
MCHYYAAVALLERKSLKGMPVVKALKVRGRRGKKVVDDTVINQELEQRLDDLNDDTKDEEHQSFVEEQQADEVEPQQAEPQPVVVTQPKAKIGRKPGTKNKVPENPEFIRKQYQGNLRSMTKALQKCDFFWCGFL